MCVSNAEAVSTERRAWARAAGWLMAGLLLGCTGPNSAYMLPTVDGAVFETAADRPAGTGGNDGNGGSGGSGGSDGSGGGVSGNSDGGAGDGTTGGAETGGEGGEGGSVPPDAASGGADGSTMDLLTPVDNAPSVDAAPRDVRVVDALGPGARGLVLYWRLDESTGTVAQDSSGGGLHGTYQGTPIPAPDPEAAPTGFVNQGSRRFTTAGTNTIRLEGAPTPLQPSAGLTVSAWLRTTSSARADLVCYGSDYFIRYSNGVLEFVRRRPAGSSPASLSASGPAAGGHDGAWHHVTGVADASGTSIWMDGKRVNRDGTPLPLSYTAGSAFSVGMSASGNQRLDGWLDDVRVYNRVLTDDEIKALALGAN